MAEIFTSSSEIPQTILELGRITRMGGRKIGEWKIIDEDYEGFFDRI